jgi:hypothetical protein
MTDDGTRTRYRDGVDVEYHIAKLPIAEMHFISIRRLQLSIAIVCKWTPGATEPFL